MIEPFVESTTPTHFSWQAVLQLIFSLLAFFMLLTVGLLFAAAGVGQLTSQMLGMPDPASTFLYAGGSIFSAFLLLPSAGYALQRLVRGGGSSSLGIPGGRALLQASGLLVLILPLVLWAGNLVTANENTAWFLLPPLHILAVVIPIFWLVVIGLKGLSPGSGQRVWGLFGVGLAFAPALILILELTLLAVFMIALVVFIANQPAWAGDLTTLAQQLQEAASDPEALVRMFQPFVSHPVVIAGAFSYIAIFVPLIEEAIKPIGIWFLTNRRLSPAEGFVAGLLSGAGYALFENLFLSSNSSVWADLVLARVGTGAVHIFTASLVGWGLASAWGQGRYLRLGLSFLTAVFVHGLWNGLTVLTAGMQLLPDPALINFRQVGSLFSIGLGLMAFLCILMIWLTNRALKHAIIASLPQTSLLQADQETNTDEV